MTELDTFPLLSGFLAVDVVNTEVVKWGTRHDLLKSGRDLEMWIKTMQAARTLHPAQLDVEPEMGQESWAEAALPALRSLRALLRSGFENAADGHLPGADWAAQFEHLTHRAPCSFRFVDGRLLAVPQGEAPDALLSLIAANALELLAEGRLATMHRCENPDCVLLFFDASGRRKWCSMKICGNRSKVARHQSRRRTKQEK